MTPIFRSSIIIVVMLKNFLCVGRRREGFTIVELLVVIVVIGILAAVTIVAFNGVKNKAVAVTMQSDLSNAAKQIGAYVVTNGVLPVDVTELTATDGTTYQYTPNAADSSYCLSAVSSKAPTLSYHFSSVEGRVNAGLCAGHTLPGSVPSLSPNNGVVTTVAGTATLYGLVNGTGAAARFYNPTGMTFDNDGNIIIADSANNAIRKMTPAGVVTTVAGSTSGYLDGVSGVARFNDPSDVAVDSVGNIFVSEQGNHKIRKITPAGVVSTFAGPTSGNLAGSANGTGASASFNYPYGLAIGSDDTLYVADGGNHRIRKITPAGVVTTIAGSSAGYLDDNGAAAQFSYPSDVAVASNGVLYVADNNNRKIRAIATNGAVTTLAGSTSGYTDDTGTAARFRSPTMIAIDSQNNLYVTDASSNRRIRKVVTSTGLVTTLAGSGSSGNVDATGVAASFTTPLGIAVDSTGGVYVADQGSYIIRKIR